MRVLHLVKTSAGASWALRQMRELVKLGVEVHVAAPEGGPLIPQYQSAGILVHPAQLDLPTRQPWRYSAVSSQMKGLVAAIHPDLIHSHFVGTTLTMRLALGKKHPTPRIFQVPGPLHLEHQFFRNAEILTAGPRDYWFGSCQWICQRYGNSGIPPDRVFPAYYSFEVENFSARDRGRLRRELGVDESTKLVGMVSYMYSPKRYLGRRRSIKGHEDLIDAVALCLRKEPNLLCVVIGGAWKGAASYEKRIRDYAEARCGDRVVFLGTRQDVHDLYPGFDVAVHPSHSEGVGGAGESLQLGVPTIGTNVGGIPDVIKDGETGWLVPPRNPPRLAEAIMDALRDPARSRQMAARGCEGARNLLDVKKNARKVLNAYTAILNG